MDFCRLLIRIRLPLWFSEWALLRWPDMPWPVKRWLYITRIRKPTGEQLKWAEDWYAANKDRIEQERARLLADT